MIPCPHCSEPLSDTATSCRECGSDQETGWSDDQDYHSIELPEESSGRTGTSIAKRMVVVILILALPAAFVVRWSSLTGRIIAIVLVGVAIAYGQRWLRERSEQD